jgi:hypothetical protein
MDEHAQNGVGPVRPVHRMRRCLPVAETGREFEPPMEADSFEKTEEKNDYGKTSLPPDQRRGSS